MFRGKSQIFVVLRNCTDLCENMQQETDGDATDNSPRLHPTQQPETRGADRCRHRVLGAGHLGGTAAGFALNGVLSDGGGLLYAQQRTAVSLDAKQTRRPKGIGSIRGL